MNRDQVILEHLRNFHAFKENATVAISCLSGAIFAIVVAFLIKIIADRKKLEQSLKVDEQEWVEPRHSTLNAVSDSVRRFSRAFELPISQLNSRLSAMRKKHRNEEVAGSKEDDLKDNESNSYVNVAFRMNEAQDHANIMEFKATDDIYDDLELGIDNEIYDYAYGDLSEGSSTRGGKRGERVAYSRQDYIEVLNALVRKQREELRHVSVVEKPFRASNKEDGLEDAEHYGDMPYETLEELKKKNFVRKNRFKILEMLKARKSGRQ